MKIRRGERREASVHKGPGASWGGQQVIQRGDISGKGEHDDEIGLSDFGASTAAEISWRSDDGCSLPVPDAVERIYNIIRVI